MTVPEARATYDLHPFLTLWQTTVFMSLCNLQFLKGKLIKVALERILAAGNGVDLVSELCPF